jgi:hypothetical protein
MIEPREWFRSVEIVWLVWAGSLVVLAVLTRGALRARRRGAIRALLSGEEGAAYALSYVLTFPFYMLLICLIVETTLILIVKMGTIYASYAAARAQVVWQVANPDRSAERARIAAVQAMAPFASSSPLHAAGAGVPSFPSSGARLYVWAYRRIVQGPASDQYLAAKYEFARRATRVTSTGLPREGDGDVTVTLSYEMPLHIPGAARLLGGPAPWPGARFRTRRIVTRATLPGEGARNPNQTLGIDYVSE